MVDSLAPLAQLFGLNTRLFRSALADLDDAAGAVRPNRWTNSAAFIGAHLVETRAWMGRYLGLDTPAPFGGVVEHATGIEDAGPLPGLSAIRPSWDLVSERVAARLETLEAEELSADGGQRFPGVPTTRLGGITFLIQHESYHIGQLGLVRKFLGLPAMSYR